MAQCGGGGAVAAVRPFADVDAAAELPLVGVGGLLRVGLELEDAAGVRHAHELDVGGLLVGVEPASPHHERLAGVPWKMEEGCRNLLNCILAICIRCIFNETRGHWASGLCTYTG